MRIATFLFIILSLFLFSNEMTQSQCRSRLNTCYNGCNKKSVCEDRCHQFYLSCLRNVK